MILTKMNVSVFIVHKKDFVNKKLKLYLNPNQKTPLQPMRFITNFSNLLRSLGSCYSYAVAGWVCSFNLMALIVLDNG